MTKTELLALADEKPTSINDDLYAWATQAAAALREYAATMDAEPVAWVDPMWLISGGSSEDVFMDTEPHESCGWVPLFLSPAPRKPLYLGREK